MYSTVIKYPFPAAARNRFGRALGILAVTLACSAPPGSAAMIAGTVTMSDGQQVAAILYLHDISTARKPGSNAFDHQFSSKRDGSFEVRGVPDGSYELCAEAPHETAVDPCTWDTRPRAPIVVAGGMDVTGIGLKMERGYVLQVRVNDPGGLLPQMASGVFGHALSLTVATDDSRVRNLRMLNRDEEGGDFFLVVPWERDLALRFASADFALSDEKGSRYAGDSITIPLKVRRGGSAQIMVINVASR